MTLIRDGQVVADDFTALADDAPVPANGDRFIVSLQRWQGDAALRAASAATVGLRLPNSVDIGGIWDEVRERPLIALEFPSFGDGRAYSQAHDLRARFGFRGELRATGAAVVRDQLFGLARCGFNSFQLRADQDPAQCLQALEEFSLAYQPAVAATTPVFRRRRQRTG